MRRKYLYILIVSIILIILAIFSVKNFRKKEIGIKVLEVATVKRGDIKDVINATAIVKTQVQSYVKVGARATGRIQKMTVDVGDRVKKGQLIAIIDQREYIKDVKRAEADYKRNLAQLEEIKRIYPLKIKEAQENFQSSRAKFEYAKWKFEREKKLLAEEFTTKEDFQRAERELEVAKSDLNLKKTILDRLKKEYKIKLKELEKQVELSRENLEKAKIRLSYTEIYSPIDGIVSKITAREGETIVAGLQVANLITILDPTKLEVRIYTDETDIGKVKVGQKVIYYTDAYPDKRFEGVISKIYPEPIVKENIVYYMSIVKVKPEYAKYLHPEMTVYSKIIVGEKKDVLLVPNSSLKYENGKQYVYKIKNGKPVKTYVKTGIIGENYTEILEGLNEGDKVAVKVILPFKTKRFN